jgi:AraC family transcriptional regulator
MIKNTHPIAGENICLDFRARERPGLVTLQKRTSWQLIHAEYDQVSILDGQIFQASQCFIAFHPHKPLYFDWQLADGKKILNHSIGGWMFNIHPADASIGISCQEKYDVFIVALEPKFLQQRLEEIIDVDRLEIIQKIGINDSIVQHFGELFLAELDSSRLSSSLYAESLGTALAVHIFRHYSTLQRQIPEYSDGLPKHKLDRVLEYINANLHQDVKLEDIAKVAGMSQYYFCRLFSKSMNIPPYQYLTQQRIERAKQLLKFSEITISDIAYSCGFNSQSHLTQQFRKLTGVTPKVYRNKN